MPAALDGLRLLDLSRFIPGMFCSMMLADMGIEVIAVETSLRPPDSKARAGPAMGIEGAGEASLAAYPLYRNKRRMELNLKMPEGRDVFLKLCETADIVLEGFRPGVVKRLGWTTTRLALSTRASSTAP